MEEITSKIGSGSTPKGSNYCANGIPFFRSQNVHNHGLVYDDIKFISDEIHDAMSGTKVEASDLLLNITGGSIGRCAVVPKDFNTGNVSQHVCIIRPILINEEYLHIYILSDLFWDSMKLTGSGREGLPKYNLEQMWLPIPPQQEQVEIVSKVRGIDSIINFINLNITSLEEGLSHAKSKILELAMQGKLVSQDPADEPAPDMLRRINPKAEIITDNPHYPQLPDNWTLTTIDSVCNYGSCINIPVEDIPEDGWVLELEDIEKDSGKVINKLMRKIRKINGVRHKFDSGDVLYSKLRTYLNKVLIAGENGFCTTEIIPIKNRNMIDSEYLCLWLRSPYFLAYTASCCYGVKMPRLSTQDARNGIIPLPPLEEQKRIVQTIKDSYNIMDNIANQIS